MKIRKLKKTDLDRCTEILIRSYAQVPYSENLDFINYIYELPGKIEGLHGKENPSRCGYPWNPANFPFHPAARY